jgi:DNA polymerase-3 subunit delta
MIILLYGPDTFRSRQKLREIVERYKKIHKSWLNLKYFDAQKDNLEDLLDWLKHLPMFNEKKLVVLKNALKLANQLKKPAKEHIILFFEESDVKEKVPGAKTQKFDFLTGLSLKKWVKSEFEKQGAKPSQEAIETLINFVGSDSWQLSNEIKKLAAFRAGSKTVSARDVELLVRPKIETDIFKTVRFLAFRNKKQALALIHQHLEKGDNPLYLLAMITWQFRRLLTQGKNNLFTQQELKKIYRKIFEADLNIKTGKMEPKTALDLLIAEI